MPVFLLAAAATGLLASWGFVQDPMVGLALVLYAVSGACTLAWSIPALAVGWLTVAVSARLPAPVPLGNDRVVSTLAVLTAAAAMGTALRTQRRCVLTPIPASKAPKRPHPGWPPCLVL